MQERTLEDKINAIGSDTIMGAVSNLEKSSAKQLEEIQDTETKEVAKEEQDQYAGKSINKISQKALHKMMFGPIPPMKKDQKVGRNDLCPCGSGKKYKNCCLDSGKYETYTR